MPAQACPLFCPDCAADSFEPVYGLALALGLAQASAAVGLVFVAAADAPELLRCAARAASGVRCRRAQDRQYCGRQ